MGSESAASFFTFSTSLRSDFYRNNFGSNGKEAITVVQIMSAESEYKDNTILHISILEEGRQNHTRINFFNLIVALQQERMHYL
jgi:hypothetical protein